MLRIFNLCTDVNARDCTWGLCRHCMRVCAESWLRVKSLAAQTKWTCLNGIPVQHSTKWATSPRPCINLSCCSYIDQNWEIVNKYTIKLTKDGGENQSVPPPHSPQTNCPMEFYHHQQIIKQYTPQKTVQNKWAFALANTCYAVYKMLWWTMTRVAFWTQTMYEQSKKMLKNIKSKSVACLILEVRGEVWGWGCHGNHWG